MKDAEYLAKLYKQLENSRRINEILDVNGEIQPSSGSIRKIQSDHSKKSLGEKWQMAQTQTLLDLAAKYQSEMN